MTQAQADITRLTARPGSLSAPGERPPPGSLSAPKTGSQLGYRGMLLVLGASVIFFILLLKSSLFTAADRGIALFLYALLVTCFQLSRVAGAVLYEHMSRVVRKGGGTTQTIDGETAVDASVSFVIPCMNEEDAIENTIVQCFAAEYPQEKIEVIVIDDGSTDGTLDVLRSLEARYDRLQVVHFEVNQGKRHGMAEGFRRAKGEIVIQLDSDSYVEPDTVRELIEPFANPEIGAVCAHAEPLNAERNLLTRMQAAYYFLSFRILKAAESSFLTVFCCSGCSSAYRRDVIVPILDDWLAERFLGRPVTWGDDRALTNRVLRGGYRTIYTHRARSRTICPEKLRQLLKQQVRWKKGWFVNSVFVAPFIVRRHPFVAFTYFIPLILLTLVTPFMTVRALLVLPLLHQTIPYYYMLGILSISCVITLFYRFVARENRYWPYVFAWAGLNMIVLSFILFYALFTIQDRRWGTR